MPLSPVRSLSTMCAQISHRFGSTRRRKISLALRTPVQAALTSASTVPDIFSRITSLQNSTSKFSEVSFCSFFRSKNVREIRVNRSNEPSFSRSTSQVNNHERCLINDPRSLVRTYFWRRRQSLSNETALLENEGCGVAQGGHKARRTAYCPSPWPICFLFTPPQGLSDPSDNIDADTKRGDSDLD